MARTIVTFTITSANIGQIFDLCKKFNEKLLTFVVDNFLKSLFDFIWKYQNYNYFFTNQYACVCVRI